MKFKFAVVLLALVAACQAYAVIDTYADANCTGTPIARHISSYDCKSAPKNVDVCDIDSFSGLYFIFNPSYCESNATDPMPTFPEGWQSVMIVEQSNCTFNPSSFSTAFGVPQNLPYSFIVTFSPFGVLAINVSISCNNAVMSHSVCYPGFGTPEPTCLEFSLQTGVCTIDTNNNTYAIQNTCVATPVAEPMSGEPMTNGPVSAPVVAPFKPPVKAPGSKTSAASFIYFGSVVVLLSLINLI